MAILVIDFGSKPRKDRGDGKYSRATSLVSCPQCGNFREVFKYHLLRFGEKICRDCTQKKLATNKVRNERIAKTLRNKPARVMGPMSQRQKDLISKSKKGRGMGAENPHWNPDREYVEGMKKCRRICHYLLGRILKHKSEKAETILGYTIQQLKARLESTFEPWMNWHNHGLYKKGENRKWSVDHIKRVVDFIKEGITNPKIINALDNLRALDFIENVKRNGRNENSI